jgi:hypothetical protein
MTQENDMNPTKPTMLKLASEDDDFDKEVVEAMKLEPPLGGKTASEYLEKDPHQEPHGDLIKKSRASFSQHLDQLEVRISHVNGEIAESIKTRDEAVARAEGHHKERLHQFERDLYQIKTLKAAVELAVAVLGYDDHE